MRKLAGDHPLVITASLVVLVCFHAVASLTFAPSWNPWGVLTTSSSAVTFYLALAASGSMIAGASGTLISLGLSSRTELFMRVRTMAFAELRRSWTSVIGSAFSAAAFGLVSAFLAIGTRADDVAPFVFELGTLLLGHAAFRLVWVLRLMMDAVHHEDEALIRKVDEVSFENLQDL